MAVLPYGIETMRHNLPPLRRAVNPLLTESQVSHLVRTACMSNGSVMSDMLTRNRYHLRDSIPTRVLRKAGAVHPLPDVFQEHLRPILAQALPEGKKLECEQIYEILELAHIWRAWKIRSCLPSVYGFCQPVAVRSQWNFVQYLLELEIPE